MATVGDLKVAASSAIDSNKDELVELSGKVWEAKELALEEHESHRLLTEFLEKKGFTVERAYTGIATAFRATYGSGSPNLCVMCEYDALPDVGHACGHNLIAEAGVATGLGVKAALECSGGPNGTITIMGSPAEEKYGGKIFLIENGAFDDIDLAMMVHPGPSIVPPAVMGAYNGRATYDITYTGKPAHAAAFPWEGVNALDAVVLAYNNISVLRQQLPPTWIVHGIVTSGGVAGNIIPETASLNMSVRAPNVAELEILKEKVFRCYRAAAEATGCEVTIAEPEGQPPYLPMNHNKPLARAFSKNLTGLGIDHWLLLLGSGSTDMGNVSQVVPSIHPRYGIGSGESSHTHEFTSVTNLVDSHEKTLQQGKSMAHTCIDVLTDAALLEEIKQSFETPDSKKSFETSGKK